MSMPEQPSANDLIPMFMCPVCGTRYNPPIYALSDCLECAKYPIEADKPLEDLHGREVPQSWEIKDLEGQEITVHSHKSPFLLTFNWGVKGERITFTCDECDKQFDSEELFLEHTRSYECKLTKCECITE